MPDYRINVVVDPTAAVAGSAVVNRSLDSTANRAVRLRRLLAGVFTAALLTAGISAAVSSFADYEERLIGVGKTTGIAGMELEALGDDVLVLARRLPVATNELLEIAQAAGQLGVQGSDNILRFVDTVGQLGLASDLAGEEAATTLARLLTVTGENIDQVDRLGSVLVRLGNNFAATEREIALTALQVAASGAAFGVTSTEAAGLATAIRAAGQRSETGASVFQRSLIAIEGALRSGGEEARALEQIMGQSIGTIQEAFGANAVNVFVDFIDRVKASTEAGNSLSGTLEGIGLASTEDIRVIGALTGANEVLRDALAQANNEFEVNLALTTEAAVAATSFRAQMQLVGNVVDEVAAEFGRVLAPSILMTAQAFRDWLLEAQETGQLQTIVTNVGGAFRLLATVLTVVATNLDTVARFAASFIAVFAVQRIIAAAIAIRVLATNTVTLRNALAGFFTRGGVAGLALFAILEIISRLRNETVDVQAAVEEIQNQTRDIQNNVTAPADTRDLGFESIVRNLEQEGELLRLGADQRAIRQAQLSAERELGRELNDEQAVTIAFLAQENLAYAEQGRLLNEIRGPAAEYAAQQQALNQLLAEGSITAEDFTRAQVSARLAFLDTQTDLTSGIERGLLRFREELTDTASVAENAVLSAFRNMEDAIVNFVRTGKLGIGDLVDFIISAFARLAARRFIVQPLFNLLSGVFSGAGGGPPLPSIAGAPTFASGGLFSGFGSGRSDSNLVRISNGEYVVNAAATRANLPLLNAINRSRRFQDGGLVGNVPAGSRRDGVTVQVIDQRRSGSSEDVQVHQQRGPDGRQLIRVLVRDEMNAAIRRGDADSSLGQRFGARPLIRGG